MQVKELIKKLLEFNLNQKVKLHTSTLAGYNCIEDILDVDQPNDTECDNVYLAGELDQCVEKTIKKNYVPRDVYEMLFDKCEKLERTIDALVRENRRKLQENYELRHPRYVFSEIPNDCDGQRFTDDLKKYLNKGTYRMRVRGQHVKEEYKGTGVTAYGQNIEQSTHLRVYIEEK